MTVAIDEIGSARNDFNGLVREGETIDQALKRLERRRDYTKLMGTDAGQRLLEAAGRGGRGSEVPVPVAEGQIEAFEAPTTSAAAPEPAPGGFAPRALEADERATPGPVPAAGSIAELDLDLVDVGHNVRINVAELEELSASIAEHGVLQPIKATGPHADGRYLVTWGQRRTLASRMAGRTTIPAIVLPPTADVDADGAARSIEQLVENLHRADLNPIDRAQAMRAVVDSGVSQAELARKLGIAPSTVANDLRILNTAPEVQEALRGGVLTAAHVKAIASLPKEEQVEWVEEAQRGDVSAHDIEQALAARRRDQEWKRERDAEQRKTVESRKASALAGLEAKKVPLDAAIVVTAGYGDSSTLRSILDHLEKAGYTNATARNGFLSHTRPGAAYCDCVTWSVSVDSWNATARVSEACVVDGHSQAEWKAKAAKDQLARDHQEEIRGRVQAAVTAAVLDMIHEHPLAARILLWTSFDWSLNDWVKEHKGDRKKPDAWDEISALPEGELAVEIAKFVRKGFTDRFNVKLDWARIERELAELIPDEGES